MTHTRKTPRRAAGWLFVTLLALIAVHYTYNTPPVAAVRPAVAPVALTVSVRGEITRLTPASLTLTLEDSHGELTPLTRQIELNASTTVLAPGNPPKTGSAGWSYLRTGYRVQIKAQGTSSGQIVARVIAVRFPPIMGTIAAIDASSLAVTVPGQSEPAIVGLTSHTAFYVPDGRWGALATGAPVTVWVVPDSRTSGQLIALTVMVKNPPAATGR